MPGAEATVVSDGGWYVIPPPDYCTVTRMFWRVELENDDGSRTYVNPLTSPKLELARDHGRMRCTLVCSRLRPIV